MRPSWSESGAVAKNGIIDFDMFSNTAPTKKERYARADELHVVIIRYVNLGDSWRLDILRVVILPHVDGDGRQQE